MNNNSLQVFTFNDKQPVRIININGNPWWVAKDVCDILGYANARKALNDHLDDDEKGVTICDTPGGNQNMNIINESGLYALIMRSKKTKAVEFRRWVTWEVLPSIRKQGCYLPVPMQEKIDALTNECKRLTQENAMLRAELQEGRKFRILGESIALMPGAMTIGEVAKILRQHGINIGQNRAYKKCREEKMLCKRKGCQKNQPTQKAIEKGYFTININIGAKGTPMMTPKGFQWFTGLYTSEQFPLLAVLDEGDDLDDSIVRKQA